MVRTFIVLAFFVAGLAIAPPATAQTVELPSVEPAACVIDPLLAPLPGEDGDLNAATPVPTPIATESAQPADPDTSMAVTERIALAIACQNAGDPARMIANFSSDWLQGRFSGYDRVFLQRFMEQAAQPVALPEEDRIELVSITEIRVRDDGVALAVVTTRHRGKEAESLIALVLEGDRWLIDSGQPLVIS